MTPPPLRVEPKEGSADRCTTADGQRTAATAMSPTAADNVAYSAGGDDGTDDDRRRENGGRHSGVPDRHQLPPSTLTPVQFEMNYGTPAADMSSKDNLLTPRGQLLYDVILYAMCSLDFNPLAPTPVGTPEVHTSAMTALLMIIKSWNLKKKNVVAKCILQREFD